MTKREHVAFQADEVDVLVVQFLNLKEIKND
jgi:hypothetical protein